MKDKHTMSTEELESISDGLFNSFDPEQELWIIGGSTTTTTTTSITYSPGRSEADYDYDINWV